MVSGRCNRRPPRCPPGGPRRRIAPQLRLSECQVNIVLGVVGFSAGLTVHRIRLSAKSRFARSWKGMRVFRNPATQGTSA